MYVATSRMWILCAEKNPGNRTNNGDKLKSPHSLCKIIYVQVSPVGQQNDLDSF